METNTREITEPVLLCDEAGKLNPDAIGWSRTPLHRGNLSGHPLRKKRWDYWCVVGKEFMFSTTIAHVDYMAIGAIYALDYETNHYAEQAVVRPFAAGPVMPETVYGAIDFQRGGFGLSFDSTEERVRQVVRANRFDGGTLSAELEIQRPAGLETLNVVVPWSKDRFQFTSKQHCMPTKGTVTWGDRKLTFDEDTAFACLDFGRGMWPYRTTWNWAAFSARVGADVVGINMGAQWTDGTGANENGIILNNRLYKIHEDIVFEYDRRDFMKPWRMTTKGSTVVDLEFTPFYERAAKVNLLVISSEAHQAFGRYSGELRVEGRVIEVSGAIGWAEEHMARW